MSRVAVVTGAASGMGEAISRHLAYAGHGVALFDIDEFSFTTSGGPRSGAVKGVNAKCLDVDGASTADGTKVLGHVGPPAGPFQEGFAAGALAQWDVENGALERSCSNKALSPTIR